jgi:hypothetical protein
MNTFRTRSSFTVNATQCIHATIIFTDCGQRKALPGDWIIEGRNREHYVVDNTFFQMVFAPSTQTLKAKNGDAIDRRIQPCQVPGPNSRRRDLTHTSLALEPEITIPPMSLPSNMRAEDGFCEALQKGLFREDVLVPLASLFAVFATVVCIMFASH